MDYPFDTVGLCIEDIEILDAAYKALRIKFDAQFTGHIDFHLEDFESFRRYQGVKVRDSYVIKNGRNDCYVLFLELGYQTPGMKNRTNYLTEYRSLALAYMKKDFGRVMIRRETLADKIIELIHPIELDFAEDKAFSDTFYVLVNDHKKAVSAIDRNFRNAVMDMRHDDFVIEVVNHTLIVCNNKPITSESTIQMGEFVARLCANC